MRRRVIGVCCVLLALALCAVGVVVMNSSNSQASVGKSISKTAGVEVSLSPVITASAKEAGIDPAGVREVLTAGAAGSGVAIFTGTDSNGQICSLLSDPGQAISGGFRCGASAIGAGADTRSVEARVVSAQGSGDLESAPTSEVVVGVAGDGVASVALSSADGRTLAPQIASGAYGNLFAVEVTDPAQFPVTVSAYDANDNLITTSKVVPLS